MTEKENARLNEARELAGLLFDEGNVAALRELAADLCREAARYSLENWLNDDGYPAALASESDMIRDSATFLEAEWRMTNGEAVTHG